MTTMADIEIQIEKCPIPMIWLDTSVLIKLAFLKLGKLSNQLEKTRLQRLRDRIYTLSRKGKLLCPEASQPSEVWAGRSDFLNALYELSLGVSMKAKETIEDAQVKRLMSSYIAGDRLTTFPYSDAFIEDPIRTLQESLTSKFIVTVDMGLLATVDKIKSQRSGIHLEWEKLRQSCVTKGTTYEEQLQCERTGAINEMISMARDCILKTSNNEDPTDNERWSYLDVLRLISIWNLLGGKPEGFPGLLGFFRSPYYQVAPSCEINSMLVAKLMVGDKPIEHGDAMDVDHISSILPYANLMVVDRRMRNMVRGLGLNGKYNTTVCYIGDEQEIDSFFQRVEKSAPYISTSQFWEQMVTN